jgi:hypothetical protein
MATMDRPGWLHASVSIYGYVGVLECFFIVKKSRKYESGLGNARPALYSTYYSSTAIY